MLHHNFCQRFTFHPFGMRQQEQGKKLLLPLEELTLALQQRAGQGGILPF